MLRILRMGSLMPYVAEVDGEIVGMALYFLAYSTWRGRMMYWRILLSGSNARTRNWGKVFDAFLEESRKKGVALVKWQVLRWNEPAINFYEKYHAEIGR
jgi:GNAT superfamily N-acetyltransferase